MAGDLGIGTSEVHRAAEVLRFWPKEIPAERQLARDDAGDAEIAARFGPLRDSVLADHASGWRRYPATSLAAVILLDRFSRNIHRAARRSPATRCRAASPARRWRGAGARA